jgi:hypothetical protein
MLVAPGGLWGFVAQRFDIQIFPVRRRLKVLANAPEDAPPRLKG